MANINLFCFLASYLVATMFEFAQLWKRNSMLRWAVLACGAAGFVAHTIFLLTQSQESNLPPLLSSSKDWLLVLAWTTVLVFLLLTALDRELGLGLFLLPVVLALIAASTIAEQGTNPLVNDPVRGMAMAHATFLMLGIGGVLLGLAFSMMYLTQHRRLKHRQGSFTGLKLPSLEKLYRLNRWSVFLSVGLLSIGLVAGVLLGIQTNQTQAQRVSWTDPIVLTSGIAWVGMIAFFAWLTRSKRSAGKQVAWLTVWACGFLLVTMVALPILVGGSFSMSSFHGPKHTGDAP
ncbi:MAG: cytochrome c biogenesis protein CcsA [Planctomycetota bacterium]|nr:cytochrome c biogenesis protein CcsA [Planctomycetota bacterium]